MEKNNYLEKVYVPNEAELSLLKSILADNIPWYYSKKTLGNFAFNTHSLITRSKDNIIKEGTVVSTLADSFKQLFFRFCEQNNIKARVIYRMALNNTTYHEEKHGPIHVDHQFPHKNFIMYLNEFTQGHTYIMDDKENVVFESKPELYKCLVFNGQKHTHGFCSTHERRIVLVVTFN